MTDSATGIGAIDPQAGVGNSDPGNGGGSNGSGASPGSNGEGLNKGNPQLEWAKAKGWANDDGSWKQEEVFKGYQSLEKAMSASTRVPDEKAKPEEWDGFHKKMGWPGDPSKYEFATDNLPKDVAYNQGFADNFKSWAHEARLPAKSAGILHDKYVEFAAKQYAEDVKAFEASVVKQSQEAHQSFVKEWGEPQSEAYKTNQESARRALRNDPKLAGFEDVLKKSGLLTKDGNFTSFQLGHMLAMHGKALMNDKFVSPNGQGQAEANPFLRTLADGKPNPAFNMSEAGRLVRQNPELARQMIVAAGEEPAAYRL